MLIRRRQQRRTNPTRRTDHVFLPRVNTVTQRFVLAPETSLGPKHTAPSLQSSSLCPGLWLCSAPVEFRGEGGGRCFGRVRWLDLLFFPQGKDETMTCCQQCRNNSYSSLLFFGGGEKASRRNKQKERPALASARS